MVAIWTTPGVSRPERPLTVRTSNPQHSGTHSKRLFKNESQNTGLQRRLVSKNIWQLRKLWGNSGDRIRDIISYHPEKGGMIMSENTVRLHRVIRAPAERVYRAFLDPDALAKWMPPNGFTGKVHHIDAKVGGSYKMSFTNFSTGQTHAFGGKYLELVPNERIRNTDVFDDPNLPGEMQTTVSIREVSCGTELDIVQEGKN
jgi:uncharacterized protein YndB with AHSA1/START domain